MESPHSDYSSFIERHDEFLSKHGEDANEKKRKRPVRFIEEKGIECALWPHLYWQRNLCETVARVTDERRERRTRRRGRRVVDDSDEEESGSEEADDQAGGGNGSSSESEDDEDERELRDAKQTGTALSTAS